MPDLSQQESLQFWKDYPDNMIFRVLCLMESKENWTYDGNPELETAIQKIGNALEGMTQFELKNQDDYVTLGNYVFMSRILRLMQAIDITHPGSASRLLMHAEETTKSDEDPCGLFLKRNIAFERLRLLARVFSQERLALIQKALERDEDE